MLKEMVPSVKSSAPGGLFPPSQEVEGPTCLAKYQHTISLFISLITPSNYSMEYL